MRPVGLVFACWVVFFWLAPISAHAERIICASTTSTRNSGLFDYILPIFTKAMGIEVHIIAAGTGAAIETAKRGDADVVLVHDKDAELAVVKEGYFVNRRDLMYNDFVILCPKADPAGIRSAKTVSEAFAKISKSETRFVSRGDASGTHKKELSLWTAAGVDAKGKAWHLEAGQGMSKTIRIAGEKSACTLSDRGTWLATPEDGRLGLDIVFEGDPALFNQYGIMAVNPAKFPHVKYDDAMRFINWLVSEEGQKTIGSFKDANGNSLFIPNAK